MSLPAFLTKIYDLFNWPFWDIKICDGDRILKTVYLDYFEPKIKIKNIGTFRKPQKGEYRVKNTRFIAFLQTDSYQPLAFEPKVLAEKKTDAEGKVKFALSDMTTEQSLNSMNVEDLNKFMSSYKSELQQGVKDKWFYEQFRNVKFSPLFYEADLDTNALDRLRKNEEDIGAWIKQNWIWLIVGFAVLVAGYYYLNGGF